jgi:hypothetical protein
MGGAVWERFITRLPVNWKVFPTSYGTPSDRTFAVTLSVPARLLKFTEKTIDDGPEKVCPAHVRVVVPWYFPENAARFGAATSARADAITKIANTARVRRGFHNREGLRFNVGLPIE